MSPGCRPRRQFHSLRPEPFPFMLTCPVVERSGPPGAARPEVPRAHRIRHELSHPGRGPREADRRYGPL
jgi:hypothetical protein